MIGQDGGDEFAHLLVLRAEGLFGPRRVGLIDLKTLRDLSRVPAQEHIQDDDDDAQTADAAADRETPAAGSAPVFDVAALPSSLPSHC